MAHELAYFRASWWKRSLAFLFDFACAGLLAACLAAGGSSVLQNSSFYKTAKQTMSDIELSSSLYEKNSSGTNVSILDYYSVASTSSSTSSEEDYQETDDILEEHLISFYSDEDFFPSNNGAEIYSNLKVGDDCLKNGDNPYWRYQNNSEDIIPNVSYSILYNFYEDAIDNYAIPRISVQSSSYIDASKSIFWSTFLLAYLSFIFSAFLFFAIVPLFFRRGYQTFGKKLFKISLINAKAVNPTRGQYWFRTLIFWLFELAIGFFAFFLPLLVSFTMMMTRKDRQSFHDYVAGTYVVDTSDFPIYLSEEEYISRQGEKTGLELFDDTKKE